MADEQTAPVTLPQGSLAEIESQRLSSRANLLSGAIQKALTSKGTAPKASPKTSASPAPAETAAGEPTDSKSPVEPSGGGTSESETGSAPADEFASETSEVQEPALDPELAELQALGKKKDLRALEAKLGLEEGSLGVNNGSWAAYRRRVDEVTASEAKLESNQRALIDRFGPPAALIERANHGDLKAYAGLIEQTTGVPIEKFIEHWSKNVEKLDPATVQLQRENELLRRRLAAPEAPAAAPVTAQAAAAKADAYIAEEAGQHPAFKLEGAKEGVRKIWLESYDKANKGFRLSPQQAAAAFVSQRRSAYERDQWILSGKKPPPKPARTKTLSRQGASESQPRSEAPLSRQELIDRAAHKWRRLKATGQAK